MGFGISTPTRDNKIPEKIEAISGFFESFLTTRLSPSHTVASSSWYNSRIVRESVTVTIAIEAADNVARRSPCSGKANIMKGIPKKARLPKIVLRIKRYRVPFENLIVR